MSTTICPRQRTFLLRPVLGSAVGKRPITMVTFRRAVVMAVAFLFTIFYLYPRHAAVHQSSLRTSPSTGDYKPAETSGQPSKSPVAKAAPGTAKAQQKLAIADVQKLPLLKQLEYHFPYDVTSKFPAYIWQTWKYTPSSGQFADKFRVTEASWTEKHPTFVHEVGDL